MRFPVRVLPGFSPRLITARQRPDRLAFAKSGGQLGKCPQQHREPWRRSSYLLLLGARQACELAAGNQPLKRRREQLRAAVDLQSDARPGGLYSISRVGLLCSPDRGAWLHAKVKPPVGWSQGPRPVVSTQ
jgi:hypothetical protein